MAITRKRAEDLIDRFKAVCTEHGEVDYLVAVKDESHSWCYSYLVSKDDARILRSKLFAKQRPVKEDEETDLDE